MLRRVPDGASVVIDALAMAGFPDIVGAHRTRVRTLALVHLVFADEPGLEASQRDRLRHLERGALALSHGVITTSAFTASRVADLGIDAARIMTAPPGTDRAPRSPGPAPGGPPQLLCVASVTPNKGQDVLVRALSRLADIPWSCICAGSLTRSPDYAARVQSLAREAGLSDRITFAGACQEAVVAALYTTGSIVVLPSNYEGFGMVLTEAMARGLPIVSTTGGAIPMTVPADAGILVPPGDEAALATALGLLLVDEPREGHTASARRAQLGAAGRRHAAGLPDWQAAAAAFAEAITALSDAE
jgi:glycosyltransferase involved in cell wall biosynthesis